MTDQEVCCTFMEPRLGLPEPIYELIASPRLWWVIGACRGEWVWLPRNLDLDACHEIEARLTDEQWWGYEAFFCRIPFDYPLNNVRRLMLHASAEQKAAALAVVLRAIVEAKNNAL